MSGVKRCPTGREDTEVRIFTVPTGGEPEISLQVFKRAGHDLAAPMGPTASVVKVPVRFAPHLCEAILELVTQVAASETEHGGDRRE
jgi:hypothetical protein